jgi:D-alanyl-D-alanine carboxypeptidase
VHIAALTPPARTPRPMPPQKVTEANTAAFGLHDWTIQIGAFSDLRQARAQLASYAEKSMDVLGQSQRIVVPFQALDGSWLYRARFGPFLEREARNICARLTERGQTCFAAIATR